MEEKKENEIIEETDKITDEQEAPAAQDAPAAQEAPAEKDTSEEKKAKKSEGKSKNPFKNKKFKYGSLSVLFTIIFVVIIVLVNVVITLIGERFSVSADLTDEGLFSIEQSSAEYLAGIDQHITITVTSNESEFTGSTYYNQTNEILKRIVNTNGNFTLNYIDIVENPGFQSNYSETISAGEIVVESEETGRHKVLDYEDYLSITYDQNYLMMGIRQPTSIEANCEQAVVSAIMNVTDDDPVKVAVLSGYGETENAYITEQLETNSYVVENVNIPLTDVISDEYDFVLINGPTSDYSVADITKIDDWLDNKGIFEKNLIYIANPSLGESPNIDGLLEDWGQRVEKGTVYQTDSNYSYPQMNTYQVLDVPDSDFSEFSNDSQIYGLNLSPITLLWEGTGNRTEHANGNMEEQVLLSSYNGAVVKPQDSGNNWQPDDNMARAALPVAVQTVKSRFEGTEPFQSRVITIGGIELFDGAFLTSATNNAQFLINIFNVSCGKEEGITLTPKSYSAVPIEVTEAQKNTLMVIFVIVLPIVLLVAGIVIWIRRIHK